MNLTFRILHHTSSEVTITQTTIKFKREDYYQIRPESSDDEKVNENKQP